MGLDRWKLNIFKCSDFVFYSFKKKFKKIHRKICLIKRCWCVCCCCFEKYNFFLIISLVEFVFQSKFFICIQLLSDLDFCF